MKKILITEDDSLMAEIYRDNFEGEGFAAEVASDGEVALQRLKVNPPDIVLLDLMLPSINGVEVLKHIRAQDTTRSLPVIVMSNAFSGTLGQEAVKAGATKCLAKNACGPKRLLEEVRAVLASVTVPASTSTGTLSAAPVASAPLTAVAPTSGKSLAELRRDIVQKMPAWVRELRHILQDLGKADDTSRGNLLLELNRSVHQLAGSVSFAGFLGIAQLACGLEALARELQTKPKKVNISSLRTVAQAVDAIAFLAEKANADQQEETLYSPLILVLDDEPISREMTCSALEQAHLRAVSVDDPAVALKLAEENRFDLIFLDVQMPGMSGFDVCQKIRATSSNAKTPIVFVTSLGDFDTRARSSLSGGNDLIGKPILMVELAVKALTHLLRERAAKVAA